MMFVMKLLAANCVPLVYADVLANNGVVHVVESVLPPADQSLQQLILSRRELSTFSTSIYNNHDIVCPPLFFKSWQYRICMTSGCVVKL